MFPCPPTVAMASVRWNNSSSLPIDGERPASFVASAEMLMFPDAVMLPWSVTVAIEPR